MSIATATMAAPRPPPSTPLSALSTAGGQAAHLALHPPHQLTWPRQGTWVAQVDTRGKPELKAYLPSGAAPLYGAQGLTGQPIVRASVPSVDAHVHVQLGSQGQDTVHVATAGESSSGQERAGVGGAACAHGTDTAAQQARTGMWSVRWSCSPSMSRSATR